jgi:5-enolpyruvylshikimate-3-phosphate synthase
MAMFAAILGLNSDLVLDDVETTSKTLPNFADMWKQLVAGDL